ncbi:MFS transporter [Brevibacillus dissolubilis]|uniref:MFS transporter n=1 Tax=Brevibacillus dissolubilis TaxID=1844116 RepID=UPI00159BB159|nr:MFS transporter [Brevibacillus dissolubilis]
MSDRPQTGSIGGEHTRVLGKHIGGERSLSLWRNRPFVILWAGEAVSQLGGTLGVLVCSVWLYELTGSKEAIGGFWLLYLLPSLLLQLVIGPYLDRWDRRWVMVISQWLRAAAFVLPLVLICLGVQEAWPVYAVALVNGLVQPLYVPSAMALLPMLLEKDHLIQANAWIDATSRLMMVLGPPVGGMLVTVVPVQAVFLFVAMAYAASGGCLLLIKGGKPATLPPKETWVQQFTAGLIYFRRQRVLFWLGMFLASVQLAVGVTMVLNQPYVRDELGGDSFQYGVFIAGFPLGYFFGSLLVGRLGDRWDRRYMMLGSLVIGGSTFILLGLVTQMWVAVALEILSGMTAPFFHIHSTSIYQRTVPNELLGRVLSVRLLIIRSVMPLGNLVSLPLAEWFGVRMVFVLIGVIICTVSLAGMLLPVFRFLSDELSDDDAPSGLSASRATH